MRQRLDNLETLGGRIETVEALGAQLEEDLGAAEAQLQEIGKQSDLLAEQVRELEGQNDRFQSFFSGLNELLDQSFAPEEETP